MCAALELLVDELNELIEKGMEVRINEGGETTTAYIRLYNFSGDLMSSFRVAGGVGCVGIRPCSFCEFEPKKEKTKNKDKARKSFATDPGGMNFRTDESVATQLDEIKEDPALKRKYGLVYSPLQRLKHFSVVNSIGIDLLHLLVSFCQANYLYNQYNHSHVLQGLGIIQVECKLLAAQVKRLDSSEVLVAGAPNRKQRIEQFQNAMTTVNKQLPSELQQQWDISNPKESFPFNGFPAIVFLLLHARVAFLDQVDGNAYKSLCILANIVSDLLLSDLDDVILDRISNNVEDHEAAFVKAYNEFKTTIKSHVLHHVVACIRNLGSLIDLSCFWSER